MINYRKILLTTKSTKTHEKETYNLSKIAYQKRVELDYKSTIIHMLTPSYIFSFRVFLCFPWLKIKEFRCPL